MQYLADQAFELEQGSDEDRIEAVIPRVNGRVHPLFAMYRRSVLPGLEEALNQSQLKVNQWISGLSVKYISGEQLSIASGLPVELVVFNMNRPEDYEAAKSHYEQYKLL
ncbi:molybdopterin-guanine dinucleotide biosynthesis protein MobA [compost metagenome]